MVDAVPPILAQDPTFGPLAQLTERLTGLDMTRLLIYLVDLVEDDALPYLGEQFHIGDDEPGVRVGAPGLPARGHPAHLVGVHPLQRGLLDEAVGQQPGGLTLAPPAGRFRVGVLPNRGADAHVFQPGRAGPGTQSSAGIRLRAVGQRCGSVDSAPPFQFG